jgi:hypothetical protein
MVLLVNVLDDMETETWKAEGEIYTAREKARGSANSQALGIVFVYEKAIGWKVGV